MNIVKLGAALVAGTLSFAACITAASAASPATSAFLTNVTQNVDFLDRSSRFALTNSKTPRLHAFAFSQAREQTLAANAIDAYTETAKDVLPTGRSAAEVADTRLPLGQEDLNSLEGLTGSAFDAEYKAKQLDALRQVVSDYQTYLASGDDPTLRAIAGRELPKAKRRLDLLGKI